MLTPLTPAMHTPTPDLAPLAMLTDEQVVQRVLEGDTPVFELLMRRHNRRLFRVAIAVVRDAGDAEDVVQESYVRAFQHLRRFEGRSSVATWLSRITFHEALRHRRRLRRMRVGVNGDRNAGGGGGGDVRASGAGSLVDEEMRVRVTAALDQLPDLLRAVVVLRLVEGLDTRETAASLRISEANVKVSLHRARKHIETGSIVDLKREYSFDGYRCDRLVAAVFRRIEGMGGGGD